MAKPPTTAAAATRPWNGLYIVIFALFSFAGLWFMRVETALNGVPVGFDRICLEGVWPGGTALKRTFTGLRPLDAVLHWLVPAFLTGPAGWDDGVRLQQVHFLVNFFAVLGIWNIEACRVRNRGRIISYTAIWAVFYQTVAGAAIIPLYYLAYVVISKQDTYLASGRTVPIGYARALLPALVIGYLVPTIALYFPWGDLDTTQNLTALWQISPVFPNILLLVLAPLLSGSGSSFSSPRRELTTKKQSPPPPPDVKHLKRVYLTIGIVSTLTQVATLYTCLKPSNTNPQLSLSYVFFPNKATWKESAALGLHYMFQWDSWIIYLSSIVWCWLAVMDVERYRHGRASNLNKILSVFNLTLFSVLTGPGTTMALVWDWRDRYMVQFEQNGTKPKNA